MKKLLALTAVALMAFSVSAMAQVDPDADGMGIYFDVGGTQLHKAPLAGFEAVNVYLLLTRGSGEQVLGYEARIVQELSVAGAGAWVTTGIDADNDPLDLAIGYGTGLPNTGAPVVLASMQFFAMPGNTASFGVSGIPGSISFPEGPGYVHTVGVKTPCQVPTGVPGAFHACMGPLGTYCMPGVGNEDMSWSQMKALY